jgi:hypothetical protein
VQFAAAAVLPGLFEDYGVRRGHEALRDASIGEELYHLSLGRFDAEDREGLEAFLAFLGSRIVFLIDWNRARKRLRLFSREGRDRPAQWAATPTRPHGLPRRR